MKSDEDKLYIKVVYVKEIYNSVAGDVIIWNNLNPTNSFRNSNILKFKCHLGLPLQMQPLM
jgi:hypothetical protein